MHITKSDDVLLLQGFEQRGGQCYLIATVGYALEPNGQPMSEQAAWQWLAPQFPDEPFDLGLQKRRGTMGVAGHAYAPGEQPVARMALRVRFGGLEKMLHVYGERRWQRGLTGCHPSQPTPFTQMPVDLAHALGGPEWAANPYGKGLASANADLSGVELPNIEWPDAPIRSVHDRPPVATLGNIPAGDPALAAWAGSFDDKWEANRFPWLPDDVDPRFFDRVAQDQCADHYWRGDERWSVEGMHPTEPLVEGALPGLQPQLLWLRGATDPWQTNHVPTIHQAELKLDTVWLFPASGRQVLLYRACLPVQREDGADVQAIWIDMLPAGAPVPDRATQVAAWSSASPQLADPLAAAATLDAAKVTGATSAAVVAGAAGVTAAATSPADAPLADLPDHQTAPQRADALSDRLNTRADIDPAALNQGEEIADAAAAPATASDSAPPGTAAPTTSPTTAAWHDALWDDICREYAEAWDHAREVVREMQEEQAAYGVVFPEIEPFVAPPKPSPSLTAQRLPDDFAQRLQREIDEELARGQKMVEAALRDAYPDDPERVDALLAKMRDAAQTSLTEAQVEDVLGNLPPALREQADKELQALSAQFEELNRRLAEVFERPATEQTTTNSASTPMATPPTTDTASTLSNDQRAASMNAIAADDALAGGSNAMMSAPHTMASADASTSAADTAAMLTADTGAAASLSDAAAAHPTAAAGPRADATHQPVPLDLRGATLENQDYRDVDLTGADFTGALLTGCCFAGAVLNGASFKQASLASCDFTQAQMVGAQLQEMDARDSVFAQASWRDAQAQGMSLTRCDLNRIDAQAADLSNTQFDRCTLDNAHLVQATLRGATLSEVHAHAADFSDIRAEGLRMDRATTLEQSVFQRASMPQCSFMHGHFANTDWQDADITDGLLAACDLRHTRARRLRARGAVFKDSRLENADWRQADLMNASFDYAVIERVDMSGSNLHGAQTRIAQIRALQVQDALLSASRLLQEKHHE